MNIKKGIVIAGFGLVGFAVLTFGASFILPIKTSVEWFTKVGTIGGGGLLLTAAGVYLDNIKAMFVKKSSLVFPPVQTEEIKMNEKSNIENSLELEESMEMDYKCLNYLTNRIKGMKNQANKSKGLELNAELHAILFKDYYLEENTSTVDSVPAAV